MEVGLRVHRCDQGLRKELVGKAYGGKDNYLGKYGGKTWGAALCSGIMKRAGRNTPRGGGGMEERLGIQFDWALLLLCQKGTGRVLA